MTSLGAGVLIVGWVRVARCVDDEGGGLVDLGVGGEASEAEADGGGGAFSEYRPLVLEGLNGWCFHLVGDLGLSIFL